MILEAGILEGRTTFGNILKYIKMTASSNFGNVFSVLVASAFIPFLPMLAIHLLIQNLLYDISQLSIPWDKMDKEFLENQENGILQIYGTSLFASVPLVPYLISSPMWSCGTSSVQIQLANNHYSNLVGLSLDC